jgi:hypothetical protein
MQPGPWNGPKKLFLSRPLSKPYIPRKFKRESYKTGNLMDSNRRDR